jgi:serine/threonine-protein kinase
MTFDRVAARLGPLEAPMPDPAPVLDALLDDQSRNWRQGRRVLVEAYLEGRPGLGGDKAAFLDLIYHEFVLRERGGEAPTIEEYVGRFPALADDLRRQLAVHHSLGPAAPSAPVGPTLAAPGLPALLGELRRLGLLEADRLDALEAQLRGRPLSPVEVGRELLRRDWLTPCQVNQLLNGKGRELIVGGCLLLSRLGGGGMGQVYKARQRSTGRVVAVKVIRPDRLGDPESVRRFEREARAAACVDHPNVVRALDAGQDGPTHYLVMEHVEGTNLATFLARHGALPVPAACEVVRQAALGLQHAHEKGLVHRDVKPSNLMLAAPPGDQKGAFPVVKVLDLGLAHQHALAGEQSSTLTETGVVLGTPDYLAPEQIRDARTADARADLYSLGCTFYHLLAGRPPFTGQTLGLKLVQHQMDEPESVEAVRPEVPAEVARIVRKLMAKKPEGRYQTAGELAEALAGVLRAGRWGPQPFAGIEGSGDEVVQSVLTWRGRRGLDRRRVLLATAAGVGLLGAAIGAAAWLSRPRSKQAPPAEMEHSPLERLRREAILAAERFGWQPRELVQVFGEHRGRHWAPIVSLAVSPDGKMAASLANDGVRLWDLQTLRERAHFRLPGGAPQGVAFTEGGAVLLASHAEGGGQVLRWDVTSGRELGRTSEGFGYAFSPDGRYAAAGYRDVRLLDGATGKLLWEEKGKAAVPYPTAFMPDGTGFFHAWEDNVVRLREAPSGRERQRFAGHKDRVTSLAVSPDGTRLLSGSAGREVRLWDVASGKPLAGRDDLHGSLGAALAPKGARAVSAMGSHGAVLLDGGLRRLGYLSVPEDRPTRVAFTPSAERALTGDEYGRVRLWEVQGAREVLPASSHPLGWTVWPCRPTAGASSPGGTAVCVAGSGTS